MVLTSSSETEIAVFNVSFYLIQGILFLNWEDRTHFRDQSQYVWSEADWPLNGWAGSDSTPALTCVSPGVGIGSKKGARLGLGGATVGVDSLGSPRRYFTGDGALGLPGYAGIGASSLGWETQEDFEEFVDPPATVENTTTKAFSSHPSRPFFLVGSSNTHIYLWEVCVFVYSTVVNFATYAILDLVSAIIYLDRVSYWRSVEKILLKCCFLAIFLSCGNEFFIG